MERSAIIYDPRALILQGDKQMQLLLLRANGYSKNVKSFFFVPKCFFWLKAKGIDSFSHALLQLVPRFNTRQKQDNGTHTQEHTHIRIWLSTIQLQQ